MALATPAGQAAQQAFKTFTGALPSQTPADAISLATDIAQGLKAELNAAILANAPSIPVIGNFVKSEMVKIADDTVDNFIASLSSTIQTGS